MVEYRYTTIKGLRFIVIGGFSIVIMGFIHTGSIIFTRHSFSPILSGISIIGSLISGLVVLTGVYFIFKGKKEFTPQHEKSVTFAGKLILYGVIIYFLGFPILIWILFLFYSGYDYSLDGYLQTIVSIPFYLVPVYLIKELVDDNLKKLLWVGFYTLIIIGIYTNYIKSIRGPRFSPELDGLSTLISIIPSIILLYCYYKTYKSLQEKYPITSMI